MTGDRGRSDDDAGAVALSSVDESADTLSIDADQPGANPRSSIGQLRPGDVFADRYQILAFLGKGGFSTVFRARDRAENRIVALKFLSSEQAESQMIERMRRELRLARDLGHPNIVRVHDFLEYGSEHCLVMELIEGCTLKELILERAPLPIDEAERMFTQLVSAIAAVHAAGIVHRDLKPQNVMITGAGDVKLLDFGLAKTKHSTGLTTTGTVLGTPDYMAPEQVEGGDADSRSDIYSLGVIAYELVAGTPPFRGESALAVALQHVRSRVPDPRRARPDCPAELARLVLRCTERSRLRRPSSAQELLVEMTRDTGHTITARARARPRIAALAATIVAVAAAVAALLIARRPATAGDPFADGVVSVAVTVNTTSDLLGGGPFLRALADAVQSRLQCPEVRLLPADRPPSAAEQEVRLAITSGGAGSRPRVELHAMSIDGREWLAAEIEVPSLDFEAVDLASRGLAERYLTAVRQALSERAGP